MKINGVKRKLSVFSLKNERIHSKPRTYRFKFYIILYPFLPLNKITLDVKQYKGKVFNAKKNVYKNKTIYVQSTCLYSMINSWKSLQFTLTFLYTIDILACKIKVEWLNVECRTNIEFSFIVFLPFYSSFFLLSHVKFILLFVDYIKFSLI